jgi:Xaa-Pro aminopeptidase
MSLLMRSTPAVFADLFHALPLEILRRRRAMGAAAELLRELPAGLTCEWVRERMQEVCADHDAELPDTAIVAHGAQSASGHEEGHGPIDRGGIVLIDIWPRARTSAAATRR